MKIGDKKTKLPIETATGSSVYVPIPEPDGGGIGDRRGVGVRERVELIEDSLGLFSSGIAVIAASANNPFLMVLFLTLASIAKASPSFFHTLKLPKRDWKYKLRISLEDELLLGFAASGFAALIMHDQHLAVLLAICGILAKTGTSLAYNIKNYESNGKAQKEIVEDGLSILLTIVALIFFFQGDPYTNWSRITQCTPHINKTAQSLIRSGLKKAVGALGWIVIIALLSLIVSSSYAEGLTLRASTDKFFLDQPSNFHAPLTVGFYLVGANEYISDVKRWHFLGGDPSPYFDSQDIVRSFTYNKDYYYEYPPNGTNYYDVWVDVGYYDTKGKFVPKISSTHSHVPVNPPLKPEDLHFLNNNPDQELGYIVAGDSVSFLVSEKNKAKLIWGWNDPVEEDGPDEINTDDMNPSHKYSQPGIYRVDLTALQTHVAGQDHWYFPVLVIPHDPIVGHLEVKGDNGLSLFKVGDNLTFSFTTQNKDITKPKSVFGDKPVKYSWDFGDNSTTKFTDSVKIKHRFVTTGNFPVTVTVTNYKGDTAWMVSAKTVTILDPPSITTYYSKSPYGAPELIVNGTGFPPGYTVRVTINRDSKYPVADSLGHFTTSSETFLLCDLSAKMQQNVTAKSTWDDDIQASKQFTIPSNQSSLCH